MITLELRLGFKFSHRLFRIQAPPSTAEALNLYYNYSMCLATFTFIFVHNLKVKNLWLQFPSRCHIPTFRTNPHHFASAPFIFFTNRNHLCW